MLIIQIFRKKKEKNSAKKEKKYICKKNAMKKRFKVGYTVKLKSGGPKMTVRENETRFDEGTEDSKRTGYVFCDWFIQDEHKEGKFHQDQLNEIDEDGYVISEKEDWGE